MESARSGKSKSYEDLSIWELEERLNYDLLSDELLDMLYSAKEEQRKQLLTKILRGDYRVKDASKKPKRSSRSTNRESLKDSNENFDTDEFDSEDWDE